MYELIHQQNIYLFKVNQIQRRRLYNALVQYNQGCETNKGNGDDISPINSPR